jgi:hypothetical protein
MVAHPPAALAHPPERDPVAASVRALARRGPGAAAARPVVAGGVVVVTQAEEPHEPHDQQADVENAEADHEDPSLGGHDSMVPLANEKVKGGFHRFSLLADRRRSFDA